MCRAFDVEDVGLAGSYEYIESVRDQDLGKIWAMINMDMAYESVQEH